MTLPEIVESGNTFFRQKELFKRLQSVMPSSGQVLGWYRQGEPVEINFFLTSDHLIKTVTRPGGLDITPISRDMIEQVDMITKQGCTLAVVHLCNDEPPLISGSSELDHNRLDFIKLFTSLRGSDYLPP